MLMRRIRHLLSRGALWLSCQTGIEPYNPYTVHNDIEFRGGYTTVYQFGFDILWLLLWFTEVKADEVCFSPVERGTCNGVEKRFAYNPKTKRCHEFVYSGCGGNQNNFKTRKHCFRKCIKHRLGMMILRYYFQNTCFWSRKKLMLFIA